MRLRSPLNQRKLGHTKLSTQASMKKIMPGNKLDGVDTAVLSNLDPSGGGAEPNKRKARDRAGAGILRFGRGLAALCSFQQSTGFRSVIWYSTIQYSTVQCASFFIPFPFPLRRTEERAFLSFFFLDIIALSFRASCFPVRREEPWTTCEIRVFDHEYDVSMIKDD